MQLQQSEVGSKLSERALSQIQETLSSRGRVINGPHLQALKALIDHMTLGLLNRLPSSTYYLSSLDPGMGKTEAICAFLSAWKGLNFNPSGSVLVCLSRREEITSIIDRVGLKSCDFSVIVQKDHPLNGLGLPYADDARVVFTTQQKLASLTPNGDDFNNLSCFHYRGQPRTLRLWDESMLPADPIAIRRDRLAAIPETLRPVDPVAAEALDSLLTATSGGVELIVPQAIARPCNALSAPQSPSRELWRQLQSLAGHTAHIVPSNRYGLHLVGSAASLPHGFAPAIILDASGRVRETYSLWEEHRGGLVRLPEAPRDYQGLTVHHWQRSASRSTLKSPQARAAILEAVAEVINASPSDEEWLVIHHMAKGGVDIQPELQSLVDRPERLRWLHWGNHHGTNDHRTCRNVVVVGLNHLPSPVYAAHAIAAAGEGVTLDHELIKRVEAGEHRHNLLQAICRASVRSGPEGADGGCTVYVVGKAEGGAKALLAETFPGVVVLDWTPQGECLTGRALEVAEELTRAFADPVVASVPKQAVRSAVGLGASQQLANIIRGSAFMRWLPTKGLGMTVRLAKGA